jgi:hypothetical protein
MRSHSAPLGLSVPIPALQQTPPVRFAQLLTATSDSSGLINLSIPADPDTVGQNFPEYGSYKALYAEVKLIQFGIQVIPAAPSVDSKAVTLAVGGTNQSPLSSPTIATVLNLPTSRLINISQMASPEGFIFSMVAPRNLVWAETSTDPSQSIAAGTMQTAIYLVGSGFPNSTLIFNIMVYGVYKFRSRL